MHGYTKVGLLVPTLCFWATAAVADPITITAGEISNTRTDLSVTVPGPGPLSVNLHIPDHPSWFGIMSPGELVNFTGGIGLTFLHGTLQSDGIVYEATTAAPVLFEYQLRTPTFPLVFGTGTPFAIEGTFTNTFGRIDVRGGGTISITEEALTFTFQPNPPVVPAPIPEPASLLLVASGMAAAIAHRGRRRKSDAVP